MCGDLLRKSLVLVGCVCGVVTAAEPTESVPEANEPWVVAEHLMSAWRSMALTTRYYNPGAAPVIGTVQRSISFAGRVDVIDSSGLIGLSEVATNAKAFDELGNPIETVLASQSPRSYTPLRYSTTLQLGTGKRIISIVPFEFTIDVTMERNAAFPLMLSRLEWSMSGLLSDDFGAIDIPFARTSDWIELAPGLEVLVEEAVMSDGKYSYRMKARYDRNRISYLDARDRPAGFAGRVSERPYSWPSRAFPEMIVTAIDVVDANGIALSRSGGSAGFSDSGDQRVATRTCSGFCSQCGNAAFIRHVIAFKPCNRELQFVLENALVPTE
jgi:hypothetical protein